MHTLESQNLKFNLKIKKGKLCEHNFFLVVVSTRNFSTLQHIKICKIGIKNFVLVYDDLFVTRDQK